METQMRDCNQLYVSNKIGPLNTQSKNVVADPISGVKSVNFVFDTGDRWNIPNRESNPSAQGDPNSPHNSHIRDNANSRNTCNSQLEAKSVLFRSSNTNCIENYSSSATDFVYSPDTAFLCTTDNVLNSAHLTHLNHLDHLDNIDDSDFHLPNFPNSSRCSSTSPSECIPSVLSTFSNTSTTTPFCQVPSYIHSTITDQVRIPNHCHHHSHPHFRWKAISTKTKHAKCRKQKNRTRNNEKTRCRLRTPETTIEMFDKTNETNEVNKINGTCRSVATKSKVCNVQPIQSILSVPNVETPQREIETQIQTPESETLTAVQVSPTLFEKEKFMNVESQCQLKNKKCFRKSENGNFDFNFDFNPNFNSNSDSDSDSDSEKGWFPTKTRINTQVDVECVLYSETKTLLVRVVPPLYPHDPSSALNSLHPFQSSSHLYRSPILKPELGSTKSEWQQTMVHCIPRQVAIVVDCRGMSLSLFEKVQEAVEISIRCLNERHRMMTCWVGENFIELSRWNVATEKTKQSTLTSFTKCVELDKSLQHRKAECLNIDNTHPLRNDNEWRSRKRKTTFLFCYEHDTENNQLALGISQTLQSMYKVKRIGTFSTLLLFSAEPTPSFRSSSPSSPSFSSSSWRFENIKSEQSHKWTGVNNQVGASRSSRQTNCNTKQESVLSDKESTEDKSTGSQKVECKMGKTTTTKTFKKVGWEKNGQCNEYHEYSNGQGWEKWRNEMATLKMFAASYPTFRWETEIFVLNHDIPASIMKTISRDGQGKVMIRALNEIKTEMIYAMANLFCTLSPEVYIRGKGGQVQIRGGFSNVMRSRDLHASSSLSPNHKIEQNVDCLNQSHHRKNSLLVTRNTFTDTSSMDLHTSSQTFSHTFSHTFSRSSDGFRVCIGSLCYGQPRHLVMNYTEMPTRFTVQYRTHSGWSHLEIDPKDALCLDEISFLSSMKNTNSSLQNKWMNQVNNLTIPRSISFQKCHGYNHSKHLNQYRNEQFNQKGQNNWNNWNSWNCWNEEDHCEVRAWIKEFFIDQLNRVATVELLESLLCGRSNALCDQTLTSQCGMWNQTEIAAGVETKNKVETKLKDKTIGDKSVQHNYFFSDFFSKSKTNKHLIPGQQQEQQQEQEFESESMKPHKSNKPDEMKTQSVELTNLFNLCMAHVYEKTTNSNIPSLQSYGHEWFDVQLSNLQKHLI